MSPCNRQFEYMNYTTDKSKSRASYADKEIYIHIFCRRAGLCVNKEWNMSSPTLSASSSGTPKSAEQFEDLWRQLRDCHDNALQGI